MELTCLRPAAGRDDDDDDNVGISTDGAVMRPQELPKSLAFRFCFHLSLIHFQCSPLLCEGTLRCHHDPHLSTIHLFTLQR